MFLLFCKLDEVEEANVGVEEAIAKNDFVSE